MPVGKINIDKRISKNSRTDSSTHTLSVNITSNHVLTSELPGFPRDYFIDKDIVTDKTASTFTTNLKDNKFSSIVQHRIPISFNASGQYKFPEITYKYFEPDTGKIVSVKDKPQSIFILSNWLKIALLIILVMILIRTIITAIKHIMYLFKLKNRRKRIVNSILAAETPHALHQFLNDYAKTYQWGSNMTLEDWRKTWVNKRKTSPDNALRALSIACYTKNWDRNTQPELNKEIYLLLTR